jgi:hypothetical protein
MGCGASKAEAPAPKKAASPPPQPVRSPQPVSSGFPRMGPWRTRGYGRFRWRWAELFRSDTFLSTRTVAGSPSGAERRSEEPK